MIYWLLSTGNCRFMKVLRYCAIYYDDIVISCQFSRLLLCFPHICRGEYMLLVCEKELLPLQSKSLISWSLENVIFSLYISYTFFSSFK